MDALIMMVLAFAGYIIMYKLYGQYIGKKIFALSGETQPPSVTLEDGVDYVPTKKEVIFGHHFHLDRRHGAHRRPGHRHHLGVGAGPCCGCLSAASSWGRSTTSAP
jgi:hypothetical protein